MTNTEALEFAKSSALMAFDQAGEYEDSYASYRENLIDTMNDEGVGEYGQLRALELYDAEVAKVHA